MSRIEAYLARLYRYAFSLSRDAELAKDLVQQCALNALAARSEPKDEAAYRAWLFVILRNALIDSRRRRGVANALVDAYPDRDHAQNVEFWNDDERLINVLTVKQAMSRLSEQDSEIIGLIDLAGLSYAEAGKVLGIPTGTVMSRISRARSRLLALIEHSNITPLPAQRQVRK